MSFTFFSFFLDVYLSLNLYMVQITLHKLRSAELKKATLCNPFLSEGFCIPAHTSAASAAHVLTLKTPFWNRHDGAIHSISTEVLCDFLYAIKASLLLGKIPHLPLNSTTAAVTLTCQASNRPPRFLCCFKMRSAGCPEKCPVISF